VYSLFGSLGIATYRLPELSDDTVIGLPLHTPFAPVAEPLKYKFAVVVSGTLDDTVYCVLGLTL